VTTAEVLAEKATELATSEVDDNTAVSELLACSADHRVSVVVAHQRLVDEIEAGSTDEITSRAANYLQAVLDRGTWAA
jgi:hypothetical protein